MPFDGPPNKNFPGPKYNQVIEKDPQIVECNLDRMDWGARRSGQPKSLDGSELKIEHVKNQG